MPARFFSRDWSLGWFRSRHALAATVLLGTLSPVVVQANDDAMREALDAARQKQWQEIDHVAIEDHVLVGYVAYHGLLQRLPNADPQEVLAYLERYADSPLSDWMRGQAIVRYGEAGRYDNLLTVADGVPEGAERQCHYYSALLGREPQAAAEGGRELWRVGRSQPEACDTLFQTLRGSGEIGESDVWARKMLAWQAGETGLVRYLDRMLGSRWQDGRDALERLQKDYSAVTRIPTCIGPDCQGSGPLFAAAMHGFTRADTEAALEAWRKIAPHLAIDAIHHATIERDLAFYALVRDIDRHRGWTDDTVARLADPELLELRVRDALADRDWQAVIDWIHRMPDDPRQDARWQYWLGRALERLGDQTTADSAYAAAADQRSFFGFAAADRLERPYTLNLERNGFDDAYRQEVANWPVVRRTEALMRIGEAGLAASEWYRGVANAGPREARAMADYAQRRGWLAKLVQTTIAGGMWDALDWRFPEAYREDFMHWGQQTDVDPYLLMGIARRESAYNPAALSPAGARGLMQVMPATATQLSRQLGIADPGPYGVLDPDTNIRLGSTYIRDMLDRYRGNRLAATAAYNAGPGRVDRWLREAPEEFDLFVESIPFRETRAYVQAVLSYRAIFESLANGGNSEGVSMLSAAEKNVRYDVSLLARR
ncbi:MAG TPA: transglycosylase SLT domain-containing protein [Halomonas sp.]|nr:transglycosylase SLT domain-containing protein [Halomonas sp.]